MRRIDIPAPMAAWLRRSWRAGAGVPFHGASLLYALASEARNAAYDAGVALPRHPPPAVVSVGGLTAGGSGKTPIAAEIGRWLCEAGWPTAIVSHGHADELEVHRRLNPRVLVAGGKDRVRVAEGVVSAGARVVVVDSGFQHRRLARDLEIVTVDFSAPGAPWRLPAGPFREGRWALSRADCIVVVERPYRAGPSAEAVERWLRVSAGVPIVRASLVPERPEPANRAATRAALRDPLALAGVMWPEPFFAQAERGAGRPLRRWALPDHARLSRRRVARIARAARTDGILCTLKDAVKLVPALEEAGLPEIPVWYLPERIEWEAGSPSMKALTLKAVRHIVTGRRDAGTAEEGRA